jgi:hypothetical protein
MIVGIKNARKEKMATKDEMLKFAMAIDSIVATQKSNYIDAIVEYCKDTGLEIEAAASLVNSNLRSKIENDAMDKNMMKEKGSRLPI